MLTRFLDSDIKSSGAYLAEISYGANDGIVTTFAVLAATALLSMIVSNSAKTAMMVPIALGIARELTDTHDESSASPSNLEIALLLGTAYAASIGGVGTLIGTPANAIVVAQLQTQIGYQITFLDWLVIGLPLAAVGLPVAWYLVVYRLLPPTTVDVGQARPMRQKHLAN